MQAREISQSLKPFTMKYHDEKFHLESNVIVYDSTIHGYGLFAAKDIQMKDLICRYSGKYLNHIDENGDTSWTAEIVLSHSKKGKPKETIYIDSSSRENFSGRWMNHSHSPNARLVIPRRGKPLYDRRRSVWYIFVECLCDIKKGEEIFIDYGKKYYTFNRMNPYGDIESFLNLEYYSGVTGEALEILKHKLIFTFEEDVGPDLKRTRRCGEFYNKYEENITKCLM